MEIVPTSHQRAISQTKIRTISSEVFRAESASSQTESPGLFVTSESDFQMRKVQHAPLIQLLLLDFGN
jgi:hypothetical protein